MSSSILAEATPLDQTSLRELIHKLRQPLSTIETYVSYLQLVLPDEDETRVHAQLEAIAEQVEEANRILVESAHQARCAGSEATENRSLKNDRMAGVTY